MSSVSKEEIKNVIEKVIEIIQKVFELSTDERNNLTECFNSKAELKNDNQGNLYIFKGKCSIFFWIIQINIYNSWKTKYRRKSYNEINLIVWWFISNKINWW